MAFPYLYCTRVPMTFSSSALAATDFPSPLPLPFVTFWLGATTKEALNRLFFLLSSNLFTFSFFISSSLLYNSSWYTFATLPTLATHGRLVKRYRPAIAAARRARHRRPQLDQAPVDDPDHDDDSTKPELASTCSLTAPTYYPYPEHRLRRAICMVQLKCRPVRP